MHENSQLSVCLSVVNNIWELMLLQPLRRPYFNVFKCADFYLKQTLLSLRKS